MGAAITGKLHGVSLSPFVRKVRAVLAHKSIDVELVTVLPGATDPAFLAKSPLSKIPVWEEDGFTLPDSSVICAYLERVVPEPAIYPDDAKDYGRALFWEEYADTRLVDAATPLFFQRVVQGRFYKQPIDEAVVRRQLDEILPPVFDQIESLFVSEKTASSVEPLTIANLSMWTPFVNLAHAGFEVDAGHWPGLAAFVEGMGRHDILRRLVEEERAMMPADGGVER